MYSTVLWKVWHIEKLLSAQRACGKLWDITLWASEGGGAPGVITFLNLRLYLSPCTQTSSIGPKSPHMSAVIGPRLATSRSNLWDFQEPPTRQGTRLSPPPPRLRCLVRLREHRNAHTKVLLVSTPRPATDNCLDGNLPCIDHPNISNLKPCRGTTIVKVLFDTAPCL